MKKYKTNLIFNMTYPHSTPKKGQLVCPQCGDMAFRVKRQLRDRFWSLFSNVKRYHCAFCGWTDAIAAPTGKSTQVRKPDSTVG